MEFGSDFNFICDYPIKGRTLLDYIKNPILYTDGRQALESIIQWENINRIFIPSYYCYESIKKIDKHGIELHFYPCSPYNNQNEVIENLGLSSGDAVIRMNYFGLLSTPNPLIGDFIVIDDHSHNLIGEWAVNSNADWCFASLRKSMPIADGGILWSPKNKQLPENPSINAIAEKNADIRYQAMRLKSAYLAGECTQKESYLSLFRKTEDNFNDLPTSGISKQSEYILKTLDIENWYKAKRDNWELLCKLIIANNKFKVLIPDNNVDVPFSLCLLFNSKEDRNQVKQNLILSQVYPAILWRIPEGNDRNSIIFGERMLSIHCDARYMKNDMIELADRINKALSHD